MAARWCAIKQGCRICAAREAGRPRAERRESPIADWPLISELDNGQIWPPRLGSAAVVVSVLTQLASRRASESRA